jgi:DNA replication protein DnaC
LLSFKSEARVDYATVPVLFIDDVGVEKDSAGIVDLIIRRKHHSLPTFCSMNFENNEAGQNGMIQRYGRVFERWTNNNEIINFEEYNFEKV